MTAKLVDRIVTWTRICRYFKPSIGYTVNCRTGIVTFTAAKVQPSILNSRHYKCVSR